jgi:hypothetical protein
MTFLVQFLRVRRGVPEVALTLPIEGADGPTTLARARGLSGTRSWPTNTAALRVMDEGGRTLINWRVPLGNANSTE